MFITFASVKVYIEKRANGWPSDIRPSPTSPGRVVPCIAIVVIFLTAYADRRKTGREVSSAKASDIPPIGHPNEAT